MNRTGWLAAATVLCLMTGTSLRAQTNNNLSDAQIQGRELAEQLIAQTPTENLTNTGMLEIRRSKGARSEIPVQFETHVGTNWWSAVYSTSQVTNGIGMTYLVVIHYPHKANQYEFNGGPIAPTDTAIPFAGSDFWMCDLGLEFFHWPDQRILKKDIRRSRGCVVLESKNARVDSWIDTETDGIVQAEAWDAQGNEMKEFEPKEFKKVNGQWELQEMEISNPQTGSRTRLEFNLAGQ
jgi:hypothetical protein